MRYFSLAYNISLYWAFRVLLDATLKRAMAKIPVLDSTPLMTDIQSWCSPKPYATRIANSVAYVFQSDAGTWPAAMYAFPMGVAMNHFAYTNSKSGTEYMKIVEGLQKGKVGATVGKFLQTLHLTAKPTKDPMKSFDQEENPSAEYEQQRVRARLWYEEGESKNDTNS